MLSLLFSRLSARTIAQFEAGALALALLFVWWQHDRYETQQAEFATVVEAYRNPETSADAVTVRTEAPVKIVYKYIERPDGTKERTKTEERGSIEVTTASVFKSKPVAVSSLISKAKRDRWLLSLDLRNLDWKNFNAYTGYGGYSIGDRVDLLAGAGRREIDQQEHWEFHTQMIWRF